MPIVILIIFLVLYFTYHSFKDGVVKVKLQGSCSGCPSSNPTRSITLTILSEPNRRIRSSSSEMKK
ncbi:MAG: NifU family protein, partial [Chitinophagaceae bacterium]|nr:NifU family protein [Chitinophagaceae bacterium]